MEKYIINRSGQKLFVREEGEGRSLVLIHGSLVDADFFEDTARILAKKYHVITYDRRGYSRSEEAEDLSLTAQAEDAADVIAAEAGGKASAVGCSAGALVAMKLASRYPEMVDTLILHEPGMLCYRNTLAPMEKAWNEIKDMISEKKYSQALVRFLLLNNSEEDERSRPFPVEKMDQHMKNGKVFIKKEFMQHLMVPEEFFDIEMLKEKKNMYCLMGDSGREGFGAKAAEKLAERTKRAPVYVPGGHNGARDLPLEFALTVFGLMEMSPDYGR